MKCTMYWNGGNSYSRADTHEPNHAELFDSIDDCIRSFRNRAEDFDPYYPCVSTDEVENGGPSAIVFIGHPDPEHRCHGDDYPDFELRFGPRGGVVRSRC